MDEQQHQPEIPGIDRKVRYRGLVDGDVAFVVATWVRSYASSTVARSLGVSGATRPYARLWGHLANALVRRGRGVVAGADGDPSCILGWAVGDTGLVHYVYVRRECQGLGIGRELVRRLGSPTVATHAPHGRKLPDGWEYRPDLAIVPLLPPEAGMAMPANDNGEERHEVKAG